MLFFDKVCNRILLLYCSSKHVKEGVPLCVVVCDKLKCIWLLFSSSLIDKGVVNLVVPELLTSLR
jgi:hypothetical protein